MTGPCTALLMGCLSTSSLLAVKPIGITTNMMVDPVAAGPSEPRTFQLDCKSFGP